MSRSSSDDNRLPALLDQDPASLRVRVHAHRVLTERLRNADRAHTRSTRGRLNTSVIRQQPMGSDEEHGHEACHPGIRNGCGGRARRDGDRRRGRQSTARAVTTRCAARRRRRRDPRLRTVTTPSTRGAGDDVVRAGKGDDRSRAEKGNDLDLRWCRQRHARAATRATTIIWGGSGDDTIDGGKATTACTVARVTTRSTAATETTPSSAARAPTSVRGGQRQRPAARARARRHAGHPRLRPAAATLRSSGSARSDSTTLRRLREGRYVVVIAPARPPDEAASDRRRGNTTSLEARPRSKRAKTLLHAPTPKGRRAACRPGGQPRATLPEA